MKAVEKIKVIIYGVGPIGQRAAKVALKRDSIKLVGAVDIDPKKVGRDLAEFLDMDTPTGIKISDNLEAVVREKKPAVAIHTTISFIDKVYTQLESLARAGVNVVSSTEELLFPYYRHPEKSKQLDKIAKNNTVTILGTGVNPGFVMDTQVLMLSSVCAGVKKIRVERVVDASTRRLPLQRKVGATLPEAEFRNLVKQGKLGHIGLLESMLLIAHGLNWEINKFEENIDPMIADKDYRTDFFEIKKGQVTGIKHIVVGYRNGEKALDLDLRMYVGAKDPHDSVHIDGNPPIDMIIRNGVAGDIATAAILVNAIPTVLHAEPGLKTMIDIPPVHCYE
jgi:4-hydroxy-tetrahydrodipicolinate reductase